MYKDSVMDYPIHMLLRPRSGCGTNCFCHSKQFVAQPVRGGSIQVHLAGFAGIVLIPPNITRQASSLPSPNDFNIENNLNLNVVSCEALKLVSTRQFTYYFILLFMYRQMLS